MITVGGEDAGKIPKRMDEIVGAGQLAVMLSWSSLHQMVCVRQGGGFFFFFFLTKEG